MSSENLEEHDAADLATSPVRAFRTEGAEMLTSLAQHRVLSTSQLHALHTPTTSTQWTRRLVGELRSAGLAQSIRSRQRASQQLWFLTPAGHDALDGAPRGDQRRIQITPETAAGVLRAHTAAINDVGIAFTAAARHRDDECGPGAWRHEVAHPINLAALEGRRGGEYVIADAVLRYTRLEGDGGIGMRTWFVELDRATMPLETLLEKLRRYARLSTFTATGDLQPAWRRTYPTLPSLLLVFADRDRAALERRRGNVLALAAADGEISAATDLRVRAALLEDLTDAGGPWEQVWVDLRDRSEYVDADGT